MPSEGLAERQGMLNLRARLATSGVILSCTPSSEAEGRRLSHEGHFSAYLKSSALIWAALRGSLALWNGDH